MKFINQRFLTSAVFSTLSIFSLSILSCSKNEDAPNASSPVAVRPLFDSPLLQKLPAHTLGFAIFSTQSDGFIKFEKSSLGAVARKSLADNIATLTGKLEGQALGPVLEALLSSGLIDLDPAKPQVLGEGVVFFQAPEQKGSLPRWGLIASAAKGVDLTKTISELQQKLQAKGLNTSPEQVPGASGFSFSPPPTTNPVLLVGSKDVLALSQYKEALSTLFSASPGNGIAELRAAPQFARAIAQLPKDGQFGVGYTDVIPVAEALEPTIDAVAASQGQDASHIKLKNLPFDSIAFARTMTDALADTIVIPVTPRDKDQTKLFNALTASTKGQLGEIIPSDVVTYLGLDGGSLNSFKDAAVSEMTPEEKTASASYLSLLDPVIATALAVRNASAASPFPEILLTIRTSGDGDALKGKLKELIGGGLQASAGMPGPNWMSKDVGGVKSDYFVTPFGVGVYLAATKGVVVLSSTEQGIADVASLTNGKTQSLFSSLPKSARERQMKFPPVGLFYLDMSKLGALIEEVQGNLAMFTGGKSPVEASQVAKLKELGSITIGLTYQSQIMKLETIYGEPPAPAAAK